MDPRPYHYEYRKPRYSNPTYQSGRLYESIYHLGSYGKMNPNADKINNNLVSPSQGSLAYNNYNRLPAGQRPGKEVGSGREGREGRGGQRYVQNFVQAQMKDYANINGYESSRYNSLDRNQPARQNGYTKDQYPAQYNPNPNPNPNPQPRQSVQDRKPSDSVPLKQYQPIRDSYDLRAMDPKQNKQPQPQSRETPQPRSYSQDTRTTGSKPETEQGYMSNYGSRLMRAMPGKDQDFVYERQQKPYNIISCYPKENPNSNTHRVYPKFTLESKLIEHGQYPYLANNPERY